MLSELETVETYRLNVLYGVIWYIILDFVNWFSSYILVLWLEEGKPIYVA